MKVECRPISTFPASETRLRKPAPFFRKTQGGTERRLLSDNLRLLEREASMLGCRHLIIEADFREGQIRQDGWPKADARPASPRVVISLVNSQHGPLRYPCDTFDRFEDNVRAVGLALEALRMVDRYGVTKRGEQYSGWKALPSQATTTLTTESAAAVLVALAEPNLDSLAARRRISAVLSSAATARELYLAGAKRHHPDAGGDAEKFKALGQAWQALVDAGLVSP